jgi:sulfite exporter TauE/SafE
VTERALYQLGRIATYATLGAVAGLGASVFDLAGYGRAASIIAGCLMILAAIFQLVLHRSPLPTSFVTRVTAPIRTRLGTMLRERSRTGMLGIGALNGLLPCGLVTSALFGSAATTDPVSGMIFMSAFGVGTLPVMMTVSMGGGLISDRLRATMRTALPVIAVSVGILVVLRGLALGIPFISPPAVHAHADASCCAPHAD